MATATARAPFETVESFLEEVRGIKAADANTEPGSKGGPTTHPIKNVPDNTRPATEGARSAENTKDVKEDQGKPSVDSTAEATSKSAEGDGGSGSAESDHYNIGTRVAATGEDASTETASAKAGKRDGQYKGPSTHPARTDNNELDGFKYAIDIATAPLEKLAEAMEEIGSSLCADIVNQGYDQRGQPQAQAQKQAGANGQTQQAPALDPALAQHVGWEMAGILSGTMDKQAADAMVVNAIDGYIKEAEHRADLTANYLNHFQQAKAAEAKRADGPPPPPGAGGGDDAMAAALGGGGPGGPGGAPPGGDPSGGPGGAPPGGGAGGDDMAQLMQMLDQLGITPQELEQALMQEQAGGAGGGPGGPPPGGAMPPGGPGGGPQAGPAAALAGAGPGGGAAGPQPGAPGLEVAAADKAMTPEVQKAAMDFIKEIVGRSRTKAAAAQTRAK